MTRSHLGHGSVGLPSLPREARATLVRCPQDRDGGPTQGRPHRAIALGLGYFFFGSGFGVQVCVAEASIVVLSAKVKAPRYFSFFEAGHFALTKLIFLPL